MRIDPSKNKINASYDDFEEDQEDIGFIKKVRRKKKKNKNKELDKNPPSLIPIESVFFEKNKNEINSKEEKKMSYQFFSSYTSAISSLLGYTLQIKLIKSLAPSDADNYVFEQRFEEKLIYEVEKENEIFLVEVLKGSFGYRCIGSFELAETSKDGWAVNSKKIKLKLLKYLNDIEITFLLSHLQNTLYMLFQDKVSLLHLTLFILKLSKDHSFSSIMNILPFKKEGLSSLLLLKTKNILTKRLETHLVFYSRKKDKDQYECLFLNLFSSKNITSKGIIKKKNIPVFYFYIQEKLAIRSILNFYYLDMELANQFYQDYLVFIKNMPFSISFEQVPKFLK